MFPKALQSAVGGVHDDLAGGGRRRQRGVIRGVTETTLSPKANADRAQAATMRMRFENTLPY